VADFTNLKESAIVKRIWKRSYAVLASITLALTALAADMTAPAYGQSAKPIIVASLAGTDEVLSDILYLTESAGVGDFGRFAALMASPYTAPMDKSRPTGVCMTLEGEDDVRVLSFLPVKDLKMLLMTLEEQIGKPEELGSGVLKVAGSGPAPMFIKEADGWAFIANRQDHLDDLPKDPVALLDGLDKKYTLAVRVNVGNIPAGFREMAVSQLQQGLQDRVAQELNSDQAEAMENLGGLAVESITRLIQDSDQLTLGWEVDKTGKKTYLDVNFTAREGTELAKEMDLIKEGKSSFAGFLLPDAAMTFHGHGTSSAAEIEQVSAMLAQLRGQAMKGIAEDSKLANDEERQIAKDVVNKLLDVADATIKAASVDCGASLVLKPGSLGFVAGGFVADGEKLADAVKKLAGLAAKKDPNFPGINFDAETYEGVTFHTAKIPLEKVEDENVRAILGDPLELVIGTGKTSAYVAFGKEPSRLLKNVLDASAADSGKQLPPSQLRISLSPILTFVAAADSNPQIKMALDAAKEYAGSDAISLTAIPIKNGCAMRLELEEGVLKAIGGAVKGAQQR